MKVKELKIVLNDSKIEYYFDDELIENIQSVTFDKASTPVTVKLEFEVDKCTLQRKFEEE